ncbi:succinate--CoA ligase subunit alpha [Mesosutterella sp. AGMB02718]|uniref:Succinate--CoA ligase [ADP-forming] subunit alpha n=1 Tax=Mesosutterella faecium TaxID=2925194 RepID=A0ABT7IKX3_9BURK|nr:succinate--CoA ligase subunit alpha [Mesosutterella sp. AGMB02718]MDL2059017.1 succinate--CoA ligase subunit alpha [Mesosutterella sp. AGMB02718]
MSILVNENTRVITQGITGHAGQFHTRACRAYANAADRFVAGVNPRKAGQQMDGIPIFATVREAKEQTGGNASVIYVPPAFAAGAILEAVDADLDLVVCITEGIPVQDMLRVRNYMKDRKSHTLLLGPNCPGLLVPGLLKLGIMPASIHRPGRIGVVSRSGTLTYEAVDQITACGLGQSAAVGIGGDPINGLKHIDLLRMFEEDPGTDAVVMIGEIGGSDEVEAARWARDHMTKPVVGFIAGITAPAGRRMGHAGAIIAAGVDTAESKIRILEECGIPVARNPAEMGSLLLSVLKKKGIC